MTGRLFASIAVIAALFAASLLFIQNPIAITIVGVAVLALIVLGTIIQRKIILPVKILIEEVNRISNGDFSPIPHHNFMAELGELATKIEGLNNILNERVGMSESMLSNIMTPMVVVNPEGKISWINESIVRLVEIDEPPQSLINTDFSTFFYGEKKKPSLKNV